jgi:hypothetical protein
MFLRVKPLYIYVFTCKTIGTHFQNSFTIAKLTERKFTLSNTKYIRKCSKKTGVF